MISSSDTHNLYLKKSYDGVGGSTWLNDDFIKSSLDISRNLFTTESLVLRQPKPKRLEVYALLSGLSFSNEFSAKLVAVQQNIAAVLCDCLHYWVLPSNFGVEYCVFKWPDEDWNDSWSTAIKQELSSLNNPAFKFTIHGIQINPDGCVIAKGYDEEGMIFKIRERLQTNLKYLPKKQSGWAHVPLGRILEPLGSSKFLELSHLISRLSDIFIVSDKINSVKFVHETRWYMEEKSILSEFQLN
jgi:hypothetical protein